MKLLDTVRSAREARDLAESRLVEAIREARASGLPAVEVAAAAGLTRQRVYQLAPVGVERQSPSAAGSLTAAELDERITDIEARWDRLVDAYAEQWAEPVADRREQWSRNCAAGKRRRKGLPKLLTVAESRRRFAEAELYQLVQDRTDDPVFDRCRRELALLAELVKQRETLMNGEVFRDV